MLPGTCVECKGSTGRFFMMEKDGKMKFEVCPKCKEKLEKEGWKVTAVGMH